MRRFLSEVGVEFLYQGYAYVILTPTESGEESRLGDENKAILALSEKKRFFSHFAPSE